MTTDVSWAVALARTRAGGHDEQALKRVWHYVAHFGQVDVETPGR